MDNTVIKKNSYLEKSIVAECVEIGEGCKLGVGEEVPNETDPHIYSNGIVCIGEHTTIPSGITIGKNTMVVGNTDNSDYDNGVLASGRTLNKAGEDR